MIKQVLTKDVERRLYKLATDLKRLVHADNCLNKNPNSCPRECEKKVNGKWAHTCADHLDMTTAVIWEIAKHIYELKSCAGDLTIEQCCDREDLNEYLNFFDEARYGMSSLAHVLNYHPSPIQWEALKLLNNAGGAFDKLIARAGEFMDERFAYLDKRRERNGH